MLCQEARSPALPRLMSLAGRMSSEHLVCSNLDLLLSGTLLRPGRKIKYGRSTCYVILDNMIIESEQEDPVFDTEPYYRQGPLAEVDHQLPATWTAYLSMRQEIRDPQVHEELQQDLMEHLWRLKGNAGNDV